MWEGRLDGRGIGCHQGGGMKGEYSQSWKYSNHFAFFVKIFKQFCKINNNLKIFHIRIGQKLWLTNYTIYHWPAFSHNKNSSKNLQHEGQDGGRGEWGSFGENEGAHKAIIFPNYSKLCSKFQIPKNINFVVFSDTGCEVGSIVGGRVPWANMGAAYRVVRLGSVKWPAGLGTSRPGEFCLTVLRYKARSNKRRQPPYSKPGFSMHWVVNGCKHWKGVH